MNDTNSRRSRSLVTGESDPTFLLAEYNALQDKIGRAVADLQRIETVLPLAIAAIYVWLWKDGTHAGAAAKWLHLLPPIIVIFGIQRQEFRYAYISYVENYVRRIERAIYGQCDVTSSVCGWESYYRSVYKPGHRKMRRMFWGILFMATAGIATYQVCFR